MQASAVTSLTPWMRPDTAETSRRVHSKTRQSREANRTPWPRGGGGVRNADKSRQAPDRDACLEPIETQPRQQRPAPSLPRFSRTGLMAARAVGVSRRDWRTGPAGAPWAGAASREVRMRVPWLDTCRLGHMDGVRWLGRGSIPAAGSDTAHVRQATLSRRHGVPLARPLGC